MAHKEKPIGNIKGKIESGKYKGKHFEINIGTGHHNTEVIINNKPLDYVRSIQLTCDSNADGYWKMNLELLPEV